jgi:hypothetical protein
MYGTVKAYEGCAVFREAIAKHPKFKAWYEHMKSDVVTGHTQKLTDLKAHRFLFDFFVESLEEMADPAETDRKTKEKAELKSKSAAKLAAEKQAHIEKIRQEVQTQTEKATQKSIQELNQSSVKELTPQQAEELRIFRVLTVTYLVHIVAFTFAAWSK